MDALIVSRPIPPTVLAEAATGLSRNPGSTLSKLSTFVADDGEFLHLILGKRGPYGCRGFLDRVAVGIHLNADDGSWCTRQCEDKIDSQLSGRRSRPHCPGAPGRKTCEIRRHLVFPRRDAGKVVRARLVGQSCIHDSRVDIGQGDGDTRYQCLGGIGDNSTDDRVIGLGKCTAGLSEPGQKQCHCRNENSSHVGVPLLDDRAWNDYEARREIVLPLD